MLVYLALFCNAKNMINRLVPYLVMGLNTFHATGLFLYPLKHQKIRVMLTHPIYLDIIFYFVIPTYFVFHVFPNALFSLLGLFWGSELVWQNGIDQFQ